MWSSCGLKNAINSYTLKYFRDMHLCPHPRCGLNPHVLLGDGTALGFQKSKCLCSSLPPPDPNDPPIQGTSFADRLVIPNPTARKVIAAFSGRSATWQTSDGISRSKVPQDFKIKFDKEIQAQQVTSCTVIYIHLNLLLIHSYL